MWKICHCEPWNLSKKSAAENCGRYSLCPVVVSAAVSEWRAVPCVYMCALWFFQHGDLLHLTLNTRSFLCCIVWSTLAPILWGPFWPWVSSNHKPPIIPMQNCDNCLFCAFLCSRVCSIVPQKQKKYERLGPCSRLHWGAYDVPQPPG